MARSLRPPKAPRSVRVRQDEEGKVAELKAELEMLPADRQEQLKREYDIRNE